MNPATPFVHMPARVFHRALLLSFALGFLAGLVLCGVALAVFLS